MTWAIWESTPPPAARGRPGRGAPANRRLRPNAERSWNRSTQSSTVRRPPWSNSGDPLDRVAVVEPEQRLGTAPLPGYGGVGDEVFQLQTLPGGEDERNHR